MSATFFVPGRLEVFGKHTDYAGGRTLIAALPRGLRTTVDEGAAGVVRVADAVSGEWAEFDARGLLDPGLSDAGWRRYPLTVIRRLAANFPEADLSSRISVSSDLPQAAGLSSSSALVIAVAEALIAVSGIEDTERWRAAITTREDRASYFACIENGAAFGPLAGEAGVGTHGGSEDHAAIVMSEAGCLRQCVFAPLRSERLVEMPRGWTFVVAASGVEARKTGAAMAAFNRLADPARMTGARRRQFDAENARVAEAAEAFARGDIARVGELAAASQGDADALLGNQVPETRALVALALAEDASAASAFGAGWGGSVWALVADTAAVEFLDRWVAAYRAQFPGLAAEGFVAPPSAGMHKVNPSPFILPR